MRFLKGFGSIVTGILTLIFLGMPTVGLAQNGGYSDQNLTLIMQRAAEAEHDLSQQKQELMQQEQQVSNPIWVQGDNGGYQVIDGEQLRRQVSGFAFADQVSNQEPAFAAGGGGEGQFLSGLTGSDVRADHAVETVMEKYRAASVKNRGFILTQYDENIARLQNTFQLALNARDDMRTSTTVSTEQTPAPSAPPGLNPSPVSRQIDQPSGAEHPCEWLKRNPDSNTANWTWYTNSGVGGADVEINGFLCQKAG